MPRTIYPLSWELGVSENSAGASSEWIPATVPGAVQLDWARAHGLPDYTVGENVRQWENLSDHYWAYRSKVRAIPKDKDVVYLVLEGIDYAADIAVDGTHLGHHEGGQTPFSVQLPASAREGSEILVVIHPAPKSRLSPNDRQQADHSCKPAVSYSWDFHPRLIPLGLWKNAYLEARPRVHLAGPPDVQYRLPDLTRAEGCLHFSLNQVTDQPLSAHWQIINDQGSIVFSAAVPLVEGQQHFHIPFTLNEVMLWWPHDQGTPSLYRSEINLISHGKIIDARTHRIGFRQVRLVMAEGQWKEPSTFPKSRSHPPITLEINGRAIFVKGANWVCPDIFPGTLTRERYAEQLHLVRDSNLAMLRMWGGAGAPHDCFYDICDELGIMVWQEFPLACNLYPDDDAYLRILDQESRSMITHLRGHVSLTFWCGGNELFNIWSGMTDQSLPLRLLNRNCYDLDPARPFLPTAPVDGMGHGHYVFRDPNNGEECWSVFQRSNCTAYTEYGCPSPASVETLEKIIPAADLWPPRKGTAWETHHAFGAWLTESHLYQSEIEHYFGPITNLADLVHHGQLLQAVGYQGMFEEVRRQKPTASMALNWCFNEPWPTAANNSLVSWPCDPKPSLAAVAQACRPTLASARISQFSWEAGSTFDPEIWLLHDGPLPHESVSISAWIELDGRRHHLIDWRTGPIKANRNILGPRLHFPLPEFQNPDFQLHLDVIERPDWSSVYALRKALPPTNLPFNPDNVRVMNL